MKKRVVFLFLFLTTVLSAFSQWGYRVSLTNGWGGSRYMGGDFKFKPGGYLDAVYDVKIYKNFYVQPGAGLFFNNADHVWNGEGYTRIFGMEAPLNLSLRPSFSEDLGMYVDFGFVGRMRLISANSEKIPEDFELLRFAGAFNIGLGVQIEKKYMIGLAYQGQPLRKNISSDGWYCSFGLVFGCKF